MKRFEVTWNATVEADTASDAVDEVELLFRKGVEGRPGMKFGVLCLQGSGHRFFDLAAFPPIDVTDVPAGMTPKEYLEDTGNSQNIARRKKQNRG